MRGVHVGKEASTDTQQSTQSTAPAPTISHALVRHARHWNRTAHDGPATTVGRKHGGGQSRSSESTTPSAAIVASRSLRMHAAHRAVTLAHDPSHPGTPSPTSSDSSPSSLKTSPSSSGAVDVAESGSRRPKSGEKGEVVEAVQSESTDRRPPWGRLSGFGGAERRGEAEAEAEKEPEETRRRRTGGEAGVGGGEATSRTICSQMRRPSRA